MGKYLFTLEEDFTYQFSRISTPRKYYDDEDRLWMEFSDKGTITVYKNYSWDGCSPKIRVGNCWVGVWDGPIDKITGKPKCYYASLLHDALCQFLTFECGYTVDFADNIFYKLLQIHKFRYAKLYYEAVKLYHTFNPKP